MGAGYCVEKAPGKVFYENGPISMVIEAWRGREPLTELCEKACLVAGEKLVEISRQLVKLKQAWPLVSQGCLHGAAGEMWTYARQTGDPTLTPMAAVAGVIADHSADWLFKKGATKVIVNNGGDIALRLEGPEEVVVGVIPSLGDNILSCKLFLQASDGVGGIAASGLGGRSFTRGVADSVVVIAESAGIADACATILANASFIQSPRVLQTPAVNLDPATDIPHLSVTVKVGKLQEAEIVEALQNVRREAEIQYRAGNIRGIIANIQGRVMIFPEEYMKSKLKQANKRQGGCRT